MSCSELASVTAPMRQAAFDLWAVSVPERLEFSWLPQTDAGFLVVISYIMINNNGNYTVNNNCENKT